MKIYVRPTLDGVPSGDSSDGPVLPSSGGTFVPPWHLQHLPQPSSRQMHTPCAHIFALRTISCALTETGPVGAEPNEA